MDDLLTGLLPGIGTDEPIPGLHFLRIPRHEDARGTFTKPYTQPPGQPGSLQEVFWSSSMTGVVRGMHVQGPRSASAKRVFLTAGKVFDVVLDVRRNSPTYGRFSAFVLDTTVALHVPSGCAHGFQALEPSSMVYLCDAPYDAESDHGVRFDTVGIPWPLASHTVSARDLALPSWHEYESPFQ